MTDARHLTLDDIADLRAYEREREEFRRQVIALKRLRRVAIGPLVTVTFENRVTMRFQIQEMARVERMATDEQILHELETYNRLIPEPGELSATLFLELTDEAGLREWLPKMVGVERAVQLHLGEGEATDVVASVPEAGHEEALTREAATSAVHYIRFRLAPDQVDAFVAGPVRLAIDHPAYPEGMPGTELSEETRAELASDLRDA